MPTKSSSPSSRNHSKFPLTLVYRLGLRVGEGGARGVPSCASSRLILALFAGAGQKVAAKRAGEHDKPLYASEKPLQY